MHPEIILGPPGTGKTTTLLELVDYELSRGVPPDRIGYVSFTKKAAQEAVDRATKKFGLDPKDLPYFRTLHSMCFRALGLSNGDVFEGKKMLEFGDWIGTDLTINHRMDETTLFGFTAGDRALFMENLARVRCLPLREAYDRNCDDMSWSFVDKITRGLRQFKKDRNLIDYTDMLEMFAMQDWSPNVEVLFVDESQDLSMLQWRVVEKLARTARRVVVAGDDDQAIYRWAGAAVEHFVSMKGDVRILDQSWRVPIQVQKISEKIITSVRNRRPKNWHPKDVDGVVSRPMSVEEIDFMDGDILVLARNAYSLRDIEPMLQQDGIIYEIQGRPSVRKGTLDAIRVWETLRRGIQVPVSDVMRVYEQMSVGKGVKRGFKKLPSVSQDTMVDLRWLLNNGGLMREDIWHQALDRLDEKESSYMLKALRKGEKLTSEPRVKLSTIHGSKGGEATHVVLVTDMAARTYREYEDNPEDEARVWYVASTRAKDRLSIVAPSSKMHYDV